MIVYFSATGNNKYIAERIAAATGDALVSISDCVKNDKYELSLGENEDLGFVTPTYFWGLPSIVTDFFDMLNLDDAGGKHYVYHILSYGTSTGTAHAVMEKILHEKGVELQGKFTVRMVDTWTPMFDLSDKEKNLKDTEAAEPEIDDVIKKIQAKATGDFNHSKGSALISKMVQSEYKVKQATKNFSVLERCVGCGLCAENCPLSVIEIQNGKPVWIKEKCTLCLACLHRCPQFAIQYANKTEAHGQFVNPNVEL